MCICIRGTLHVSIDTNFHFRRNFSGQYQGIYFKYVLGQNGDADCIIAAMAYLDVEQTYELITELVSIFSYALDKGFIVGKDMSDTFRGQLEKRQPMILQKKMLNLDITSTLIENLGIVYEFPNIDTYHKSNLVRLYRLARIDEYVNKISSFLFYYHILDYSENDDKSKAREFINLFVERESLGDHVIKNIKSINNNRVFEKQGVNSNISDNDKSKSHDDTLGEYIRSKVRNSVGHIIRKANAKAHDLKIDSFEQNSHFRELISLMKIMARAKLEEQHGFDKCCDEKNLHVKWN